MSGISKFTWNIEARLSTYYGLYFMSIGCVMPFVALWFDTLNISSAFSGAIFAAPSIVVVLFTIVIGGWADRLSDWRTAIIVCNWIPLVLLSWFLLRTDTWDILIVWTLAGLFTIANGPIMDAAALNLTRIRNTDYARIRAIGSIGFIVGVLLAGAFFEQVGYHWFVAVLLAGAGARTIAAHALPRFRSDAHALDNEATNYAGEAHGVDTRKLPLQHIAVVIKSTGVLSHPGIMLVIIGAALINASHSFNNVFAVLHWTQSGISTNMASILWSIGVTAEVALIWGFRRVAKTFSTRKCLIFAGTICAARWLLSGVNPGVIQLVFLQSLHAITFGLTFLASVNFIARRVREDNAAQAQSVSATLVTLFMGIGVWLSGWLYAQFAGQSYWAMALMAFVGAICVGLSFGSDLDDSLRTD